MRLKTSNLKEPKHSELVSCVSWMSPDDVVSIADDQKIFKWNLVTAETSQLGELPPPEGASHPTDMHWFPRGQPGGGGGGGGGKGGAGKAGGGGAKAGGGTELYLVTTAEGRLLLIGKTP